MKSALSGSFCSGERRAGDVPAHHRAVAAGRPADPAVFIAAARLREELEAKAVSEKARQSIDKNFTDLVKSLISIDT
jgi:hypothetical protein